MRQLLLRFVMTLVLALLLLVPTHAAAPSIIMIYGDPLERPLVITRNIDGVGFLFGGYDRGQSATVAVADLKDRRFVKVAIYWGGGWWKKYVEDGEPLSTLRPEEANQHGRLYLPTATEPAVALKTPGFFCVTDRPGLRGGHPGPPPAWPMPLDPNDLVCAVKLTTADAKAARELGIPGF
jgi:hypothetical protein